MHIVRIATYAEGRIKLTDGEWAYATWDEARRTVDHACRHHVPGVKETCPEGVMTFERYHRAGLLTEVVIETEPGGPRDVAEFELDQAEELGIEYYESGACYDTDLEDWLQQRVLGPEDAATPS